MEGKMIAGMYDLEETLGSGHFAVVKLARHVITGDHVAVKVIDKTKLDQTARDHLFQEVRCMKLVQHPSIIRLYQVIDTQSKLYLILELGENGDLYEYISKHSGGVGEDESRDLFRQIVEAIAYCHRLHVVHRDLKPENVVFCQNAARVKVTDFGLSNLFAPGEMLKTSCGSLSYAAPEILLGDMYDAPAVDLWSLGVILYMLLVGEKPFVGGTDSETLTMIMDCKFDMPAHLSPESVDLVKKLLVSDPKQRISLDEVFRHPWMQRTSAASSSRVPLPTVHRSELDADDRRNVIQKMVDRGVADVDSIHRSLESNAYDHIAATYYLMAEAHQRDKDDVDSSPVSDMDLQRLDRRRQRVRKLSTPGSPLRTGSADPNAYFPSLDNANYLKATAATPTKPLSVPRPLPASNMDTFELGPIAASSPGRGMRRGAAETGTLRPVRRTPFTVQSVSSPLQSMPGSPGTPMGGSLRRSSVTCKLHSAKSEENFGVGSLHFTLPMLAQTTSEPVVSPEEEVSTTAETTPVSSAGVTPQRSLVLIEESETIDEVSDSEGKESIAGLTLDFEQSCDSDGSDKPLARMATPTGAGMYPNWLTGHQSTRTRSPPNSESGERLTSKSPSSAVPQQSSGDRNGIFNLVRTTV